MTEEEKVKIMQEQYSIIKQLISYLETQNISDIGNIASILKDINRILSSYKDILDALRASVDMLTIDLVDLTEQDVCDVNTAQELINNFIARWNRIAINIRQSYNF